MHRSPMRHCPSALPLRLIRALPRPAPGAVAPAVTGRGLTAFSRRSPRQPRYSRASPAFPVSGPALSAASRSPEDGGETRSGVSARSSSMGAGTQYYVAVDQPRFKLATLVDLLHLISRTIPAASSPDPPPIPPSSPSPSPSPSPSASPSLSSAPTAAPRVAAVSVVICCGTRDSLDHVLAALSPLHHRFLLASLVRPLTRHCSCPPLVLHPFSVPHPLSPPLPPLVVPLAFPIVLPPTPPLPSSFLRPRHPNHPKLQLSFDQSDAQRRAVLAAFHAAVALSRGRPAPPLALPLAPPFSPHPAPSLPSAAPPSHGPHATHGPPAFLSPPTHAPLLHSRVGEGEGQAAEVAERGDEGGESGGEEGRGGQGAVVPVVVVTDACLPCGHGGGEAPLGARLLINYDFPPRKDVYLRRVAMCMGQAAASAMQRPEPSASTTATASSSSSSAAGMSLLFVTGGEVPVVRTLEDALGTLLHEMPIDVCEALKQ
ncbi:unnamed protein product [Closterium sp. NIES-65]|nr:unnamed protein product [Closterium sp. NIES-65]